MELRGTWLTEGLPVAESVKAKEGNALRTLIMIETLLYADYSKSMNANDP
jgi:hypothetical protein